MLLHLGIQFNLFVLSPSTFIAVCVFHMQRESEPSTKEMRTKSSTQSDLKKKKPPEEYFKYALFHTRLRVSLFRVSDRQTDQGCLLNCSTCVSWDKAFYSSEKRGISPCKCVLHAELHCYIVLTCTALLTSYNRIQIRSHYYIEGSHSIAVKLL